MPTSTACRSRCQKRNGRTGQSPDQPMCPGAPNAGTRLKRRPSCFSRICIACGSGSHFTTGSCADPHRIERVPPGSLRHDVHTGHDLDRDRNHPRLKVGAFPAPHIRHRTSRLDTVVVRRQSRLVRSVDTRIRGESLPAAAMQCPGNLAARNIVVEADVRVLVHIDFHVLQVSHLRLLWRCPVDVLLPCPTAPTTCRCRSFNHLRPR